MHNVHMTQKGGSPSPLGVSKQAAGLNFALVSQHARAVTLHLFREGSKTPFVSFPLDPATHKTGWVWHLCVEGLETKGLEYAYQIEGNALDPRNRFHPGLFLSDPYALSLNTSHRWGEPHPLPRGRVILDQTFDWEGTSSPKIPLKELIIYELHVRGFTVESHSEIQHPGTFLALIDTIPYLKSLGVNAIELMPIFEFNECELPRKNVWGYSTINFFAPMNRYASGCALNEFRTLVREMHRHGIEVYLDVVYNHTAEGNDEGPCLSFKGIDNQIYYLLGPDGDYLNYSGTGNTFNANHPVVAELIVDSLRYWVEHMHVDGFRFDLASCLTRDKQGDPSPFPLVIEKITNDPVLAEVKLIAEAWDAAGLYQVGHFPGGSRWLEWNGKYRDVVRRFIKGSPGQSGPFAQALCGSADLYGHNRTPCHSINFITAHDGFTLYDLVSYQEKHNQANGENNQDGCNDNESWNCGHEGETTDPEVLALRGRQMRNFHVALMVSLGTPMLLMGDEYAHTKGGNNNTYCQDNKLNSFLWNRLKEDTGWVRFYERMIHWRKDNPLVRQSTFLNEKEVLWHGTEPLKANWAEENRFLAYTLVGQNPLYIAFNAQSEEVTLELPKDQRWYRIVDTSLPSPDDFVDPPQELSTHYTLPAYSALIAKAL